VRLLPFIDINVIEDNTPSAEERLKGLVEWAEGEKIKMSAACMAYDNNGESVDDYVLQIGYIKDGRLVTSKEAIEEVGKHCEQYKRWKTFAKIMFELRCHLELYYNKVGIIPPWGSSMYQKLENKGFTPRVLEGPHKAGGLRPNQKRKIILDASNEIVFGPLLQ
jgi:hypothetical protein